MAIFGFSFKANTNDTRESPSKNISKMLLIEGAELAFYDPKVSENQIRNEFEEMIDEGNVLVFDSASEAAERADAIVVLTEWDEFINLDWESIYEKMRKPAWIFDSRSFLNKEKLISIGFKTWSIGAL